MPDFDDKPAGNDIQSNYIIVMINIGKILSGLKGAIAVGSQSHFEAKRAEFLTHLLKSRQGCEPIDHDIWFLGGWGGDGVRVGKDSLNGQYYFYKRYNMHNATI